MEMMNVNDDSTYEDSDDETNDDYVDIKVESQSSEEEYQHEVLSTSHIVQHMFDIIDKVNEVLQLSPTTTRMLLSYVHWDEDKLLEKFFGDDQDQLFREAKAIKPFKQISSTANPTMSLSINGTEECDICFRVYVPAHMTGLECCHRFCYQCWDQYVTTKIDEGGEQTITCPAFSCYMIVEDKTILNLIKDAKVKTRYQLLITNSFVEWNKLLKWCPSPGCNYAIKVAYVASKPVVCRCRYTFCSSCGEEWHYPVKCSLLKQFLKKCVDYETSKWISANTKKCPSCQSSYEKDNGCSRVVCTNEGCRISFCWNCLETQECQCRENHANKDKDEAKAARDAQELGNSVFYFNKYIDHMNSLKFEQILSSWVRDKVAEMRQYNMSWDDLDLLTEAVDVLCKCRQTLMYTYVFAYYLEKNQSIILVDNQNDLTTATNKLRASLERAIIEKKFEGIQKEVREKILDCDLCARRIRETLVGLHGGIGN